MKNYKISILIAGDLVPTSANERLFYAGDIQTLVGAKISELFKQSDISIVNLECPITANEHPIEKQGPNLKTSPKSIKGIKKLNPTIIGLANNHIMDFGDEGLHDTRRILSELHLPYVGVGDNLEEAISSLQVVVINGKRIGFYACAEHEFSIATRISPGANPFDSLVTGDVIQKLKIENDLEKLLVLFHGGKEYYQYPSPNLQRICRHLVEKGADLVVCQHSHCIGAYERYMDADIVYGQGNFIFDLKNPLSVESLLISYQINPDGTSSIDFLPIQKRLDGSGTVFLAQGEDRDSILTAFQKRSKEIEQPGFIERNYSIFAGQLFSNYLYWISPFGKWFSRIDRYIFKGRLIAKLYSKKKLLAIQNFIECEAHWELLCKGLFLSQKNKQIQKYKKKT